MMRALTRADEKEATRAGRFVQMFAPYFVVRTNEGNLRFDTWDQVEAYLRNTPAHLRNKVDWRIIA